MVPLQLHVHGIWGVVYFLKVVCGTFDSYFGFLRGTENDLRIIVS
jgi:hypothetical protein